MKKRTKAIFLSFILITSIAITTIFITALINDLQNKPKSKLQHMPGKDTVFLFGDGRYQIFRPDNVLIDIEDTWKTIEKHVYSYCDIKPKAYIIGSSGYTIINYENREIKQFKELDKFDKEEIHIFNSSKKFKQLK